MLTKITDTFWIDLDSIEIYSSDPSGCSIKLKNSEERLHFSAKTSNALKKELEEYFQ